VGGVEFIFFVPNSGNQTRAARKWQKSLDCLEQNADIRAFGTSGMFHFRNKRDAFRASF